MYAMIRQGAAPILAIIPKYLTYLGILVVQGIPVALVTHRLQAHPTLQAPLVIPVTQVAPGYPGIPPGRWLPALLLYQVDPGCLVCRTVLFLPGFLGYLAALEARVRLKKPTVTQ